MPIATKRGRSATYHEGGLTHKVTQRYNHVVMGDQVVNYKTYLHFQSAYGHKTWQDGD